MDDAATVLPEGERNLSDAAPQEVEAAASSEVPKPKRKARKKKLAPKSSDDPSGWLQEVPPEVAIPHVVDLEGLLAVLSTRHAELDSKLEGWMQRQEAMLKDLGNKLSGSDAAPAERSRAAEPAPVEAPSAKPEKLSKTSVMGRSPTLKNFAEKVLRNTETPTDSVSPLPVERRSQHKAVNFLAVAAAVDGEAGAEEILPQVTDTDTSRSKDRDAIASVDKAVSSQTAKSKKSHKRMRTSREVQAAYLERMRREMAKTRRRGSKFDDSWKGKMEHFLQTPYFEIIMMVLSVTCAVVVGVEVNWFAENIGATSAPTELLVLNHVLSLFFALELGLKVWVYRCEFFTFDIGWHALDMLIVSTGMAELIIDVVSLVNAAACRGRDCENPDESIDLSILRAVRIGRVVRLARLARLVQYIRELRRLILSVAGTLKAVFWAIVLLALFIYTFAVIFQQAVNDYEHDLVTKNSTAYDPAANPERGRFFDGILRTAMTLLQTATGGVSWIEVEAALAGISPLLVLIFLMYFSFIYFAILNVVTGVFCSSAIESASEDAGMLIVDHMRKTEEYATKLTNLFKQIDADNSDTISILEFEENFHDPEVKALFQTLGIDEDKAWKLFEILDENEDGEIHVEEFVSRCFKLRGSAQRLDTERIYAVMKRQSAQLDDISGYVNDLLRGITSLVLNQQKRSGTIGRSQTSWNPSS
ncbi:CACNA1E [Symbiodinium sp. CCMP2592]|nr:CACNA1E [Symbiodinium sp. CCMP2592]